jgi:hypothetical protein
VVLAGERVAERKVWSKVVCRFFIVSEVTETLVRIKSILRKDLSVSGNPTGWKICVKELLNRCRLLFPLPE